tara:strand:- start:31107 stop:31793 length:687 start_codon:yes stop_codon:yes gene_type:complete
MINDKRVLAITLARGGSKRVPKKNMVDICGQPLLKYTIDEVKKSEFIDDYVVSSDDQEIISFVKSLGISTVLRPTGLAKDTSKSSDAILHVLSIVPGDYDYIVEVMCTNPLKLACDIDGVIKKLDDLGGDSAVSVCRVWDYHPSRIKFIENDTLVDVYPEVPESRRQDLTPPAYIRNGSIYAFRVKTIKEYGSRLGDVTRPYIMPESRTINIDEPIDLELARIMVKKR